MPRYFLDVHHGNGTDHEPEGQELPSLDAAREEAFTGARQIVGHALLAGSSLEEALDGGIIVKGEDGAVLLTVSFVQSVEASLPPRPLGTGDMKF